MKRRRFLHYLGFGIIGAELWGASSEEKKGIKLGTFKAAGFQHHAGVDSAFEPGEEIELRREVDNAYDRRAVALYRSGEKIGYLPRSDNKVIANMLDSGAKLTAEVRYCFPDRPSWERVWVSIWQG